jgi:predicted dehydrogenase
MSKIKLGAIGVGARLSRLLSDMLRRHGETVELTAISDEEGGAIEFARHLFPDVVRTYTDHSLLLEDDSIEWILIGSKNYMHARQCMDAFAAGKHVFCEKPLAVTIDECEQIRQAHQRSGMLFATGFVLRYAPLYRKIYEIVQQIMELHGGRAWVEDAPDGGARFLLELPGAWPEQESAGAEGSPEKGVA